MTIVLRSALGRGSANSEDCRAVTTTSSVGLDAYGSGEMAGLRTHCRAESQSTRSCVVNLMRGTALAHGFKSERTADQRLLISKPSVEARSFFDVLSGGIDDGRLSRQPA